MPWHIMGTSVSKSVTPTSAFIQSPGPRSTLSPAMKSPASQRRNLKVTFDDVDSRRINAAADTHDRNNPALNNNLTTFTVSRDGTITPGIKKERNGQTRIAIQAGYTSSPTHTTLVRKRAETAPPVIPNGSNVSQYPTSRYDRVSHTSQPKLWATSDSMRSRSVSPMRRARIHSTKPGMGRVEAENRVNTLRSARSNSTSRK